MHFSATRSLTQPLLDCILYLTLTQHRYDPGTLTSSANQCILGKVYLRSTPSREAFLRLSFTNNATLDMKWSCSHDLRSHLQCIQYFVNPVLHNRLPCPGLLPEQRCLLLSLLLYFGESISSLSCLLLGSLLLLENSFLQTSINTSWICLLDAADSTLTSIQVQHNSLSTAIKVVASMYLIRLDLNGKSLQMRLRLWSLMSASFPRLRLQRLCAVMRLWE